MGTEVVGGAPGDALGAGRGPAGRSDALAARIEARARELGFDLVGFANASEPPRDDFERYARFVAQGWHGTMAYLERQLEPRRRVDGSEILAGARTVICLGWCYHRPASEEQADPPLARLMARYARGSDYHGWLRKRLGALAAFVRGLAPRTAARAFCDSAPLLERAWAVRAGLGYVGHNAMLIAPACGSYLMLGEVVTTLELPPSKPAVGGCGECRACLEACPTGALIAPRQVEARRCVAYLTTEHREAIPPELGASMGCHLFGCDECQQACPHNAAPRPALDPSRARPLERWARIELGDLVTLDDATWRELSQGTALGRVPAPAMARNARLAFHAAARTARGPSPTRASGATRTGGNSARG